VDLLQFLRNPGERPPVKRRARTTNSSGHASSSGPAQQHHSSGTPKSTKTRYVAAPLYRCEGKGQGSHPRRQHLHNHNRGCGQGIPVNTDPSYESQRRAALRYR
jgi:hypothetical protein